MKEEKQMSKNIADLYNEVMSSQAAEKTAADVSAAEGAVFDRSFFEKVASGDEDAVGALNSFIDEARAEGHSDEEIESAIGQAMADAGIDDEDGEESADDADDDFENAKMASYQEGAAEAFAHVMGSEAVKTAGITEADLVQYHLGLAKGQGYAETRQALEEVVEKIAAAKVAKLSDIAGKAKNAITSALSEAKSPRATWNTAKELADAAGMKGMSRAAHMAKAMAPAAAVYGAGAAGAGGAAYGAKKMYDKRKKNK